ncbi:hypothetical protein HCN44_007203 [Aphidius gifuensis]|uniref:MADF domain-containing protein n=1 Tax=Aphidius gifuensis TaxID=684658 RepID=A0A835CP79_APHGI|nr:hypothetical protein HCN44_007203 [Aphidius gifuensis]
MDMSEAICDKCGSVILGAYQDDGTLLWEHSCFINHKAVFYEKSGILYVSPRPILLSNTKTTKTERKSKENVTPVKWTLEMQEDFISLVKKNDDLRNYEKLLSQRSSEHTEDLWVDILDNMKANHLEAAGLTVKDLTIKWKSLRNSFSRVKRLKRGSTGSAAPDEPIKKWAHEESMAFLDEVIKPRATSTNLNEDVTTPRGRGKKNIQPQVQLAESLNKIAAQREVKKSENDSCKPFMLKMGSMLDRIKDDKIIEKTLFDIHKLVHDASKQWDEMNTGDDSLI